MFSPRLPACAAAGQGAGWGGGGGGQGGRGVGERQQAAVGGADLPAQDAAGAHSAATRHVRGLHRGEHGAHVCVRLGERGHCETERHLRSRALQDL